MLRFSEPETVEATSVAPFIYPMNGAYPLYPADEVITITYDQAMTVPAVARARNAITTAIANMPILKFASDGTQLPASGWQVQPDELAPRPYTIAWTISDLIFYPFAYWQITRQYSDGFPANFQRIDPLRVTWQTNNTNTVITQFFVDGQAVPLNGVGSLIVFPSADGGVLARAGRTLRTAIALERAAYNSATDPTPAGIIKNTGYELGDDEVISLLAQWRQARQQKATAYLNPHLDYEAVGFDPKSLQLTEARQYIAGEIARLMNVPASIVAADTGDSMTYSNAQDYRRDLRDYCLKNYVGIIEHRLSMKDVTPQGQYVRFGFTEFLRGSDLERVQVITQLLAAGVITIDEARQMEDLAPMGGNSV